jgi:hypothetical protein
MRPTSSTDLDSGVGFRPVTITVNDAGMAGGGGGQLTRRNPWKIHTQNQAENRGKIKKMSERSIKESVVEEHV